MPTLEAIVAGTTYNLNNGTPFAYIDEEDGMAEVRRITERGPQQDGDTDIDQRLEPRTFPLGLIMYSASAAALDDNRDLAYRIFRPSRIPIRLRWTRHNGSVRQLDCHVSGKLLFPLGRRAGFSQRFVVPLRAADPRYYDPTQQSESFALTVGTGWTIPWEIPWTIGNATFDVSQSITYAGTWRDYPVITIKGPITDCVIENTLTGDRLDFTGTMIGLDDTYTIDLRFGAKTVVDAAGNNVIDRLVNSDLATWSLEAAPEAPGGVNPIRVTGAAATTETEITILYYLRYVGI